MMDYSLGGPVNEGCYSGPLLEGKPLHSGNCTDSTYGCMQCGNAALRLTDEQLTAIGYPITTSCDWCKADKPSREVRGVRPWDEPSCYYEVCRECRQRHDEDLNEQIRFEEERKGRSIPMADDDYDDG